LPDLPGEPDLPGAPDVPVVPEPVAALAMSTEMVLPAPAANALSSGVRMPQPLIDGMVYVPVSVPPVCTLKFAPDFSGMSAGELVWQVVDECTTGRPSSDRSVIRIVSLASAFTTPFTNVPVTCDAGTSWIFAVPGMNPSRVNDADACGRVRSPVKLPLARSRLIGRVPGPSFTVVFRPLRCVEPLTE
jgi:hypothetical protein